MKVSCIANTSAALSERHLKVGYTSDSVFHLVTGRDYQVFGISIFRGNIQFLLVDETQRPNWHPAEMFKIIECSIPSRWLVGSWPDNELGLQLLVGYPAMIEDDSHYDGLIERDNSSLQIFREEMTKMADR